MYDYVDGKADWMAYGLPVEGEDGPFVGDRLSEVPTCAVDAAVGEARRLLDESGGDLVVVVAGDRLAVGEIDLERIEIHGEQEQVLDVMGPVPSTVRPSVTVASVAEAGGGPRLVTTSDGHLLGMATIEPSGHEHESDEMERYERELAEVMEAVRQRFGDREPAEEELRAFQHERLVGEGRSAEEADRFLDELAE